MTLDHRAAERLAAVLEQRHWVRMSLPGRRGRGPSPGSKPGGCTTALDRQRWDQLWAVLLNSDALRLPSIGPRRVLGARVALALLIRQRPCRPAADQQHGDEGQP